MNNTDTDWLTYSDEAKSIRHLFYDVKFILLVEGKNDIPFWNHQFGSYISEAEYKILRADGKNNFKNDIEGIQEGRITNVVVACDADYTDFHAGGQLHPCIVRTYGHSIENTMFCPVSISEFIKTWTCTTTSQQNDIETWIHSFCASARNLLPYEINNDIDPTHCEELPEILNGKYHQLKVSDTCCDLDDTKITNHISTFRDKFNPQDISDISARVDASPKELRHIIQGHFLAAGLMEYIKQKITSIIGNSRGLREHVFYLKFSECPRACKSACVDIQYLRNQIDAVADRFSCTKIS